MTCQMKAFLSLSCWLKPLAVFLLLGAMPLICVDVAAESNKQEKERTSSEGIDPDKLPPEMTRSLEDLLNDPEGVEPDLDEVRCINRRATYRFEILDEENLLVRSSVGKRAWLNRMERGCVGLRPDMILIIEGRGANICQLDTVRGRSRVTGAAIQTGRCSLGKFEPITPLHAQALEDTFKLRRKEIAEARRKERAEKRKQRRAARKERRALRKAAQATTG